MFLTFRECVMPIIKIPTSKDKVAVRGESLYHDHTVNQLFNYLNQHCNVMLVQEQGIIQVFDN